jgi:hypothetical protein
MQFCERGNKMKTTLYRSYYGDLSVLSDTLEKDILLLKKANKLVKQTADKGYVEKSFDNISFDRKHRADGNAIHHEIYDIQTNPMKVLLCVRRSEGNKYGVKTTSKDYVLISRKKSGIVLQDMPKTTTAKTAKKCEYELGLAIDILTGKKKFPKEPVKTFYGYKIVKRENGSYFSVFDNSEWKIGKTRIEKAYTNHGGGFYFYETIEGAIFAANRNEIFNKNFPHDKLAILKVEVSGKMIEYRNGKIACSKMTPIEDIGSTI